MLFKKQIRKLLGVKVFDIIMIISVLVLFRFWMTVYILAGRINDGGVQVTPLSEYIRDALVVTAMFLVSAYYAIDFNALLPKGFMEEEKLKQEIDQRILDAQVSLKEIREGVSIYVDRSSKFDDYAKKLISSKTKTSYDRCVKRLKYAQKLREDADRIPMRIVKDKLLIIQDYLIKHVSMGTNQLGEILARIHQLNTEKVLGTKDIEKLGEELDEELRIAEIVDKTMVEWEYGIDPEKI